MDLWESVDKFLSPREAEIVKLYYRDGLTCKEIGAKVLRKRGEGIGISESAISVQLKEALRKLRKHFGPLM